VDVTHDPVAHGRVDAGVAVAWLRATMRRRFAPVVAVASPPVNPVVDVVTAPIVEPTVPLPTVASAPSRGGLLARFRRQAEPPITVAPQPTIAPRPAVAPIATPVERDPEPSAAAPALPAAERDPAGNGAEAWRAWPELLVLANAFGLTDDECRVLLLAAAPELDSTFPAFCDELFGQAAIPTFALGDQLFPGSAATVTAQDRPLRHFMLIEIFQPGGTPMLQSEVHASEWVIERLLGGTAIDHRLADGSQLMEVAPGHPVAPSQREAAESLVAVFRMTRGGMLVVAQVCGPGGDDKKAITALAARGVSVFRLRPDALSLTVADIDLFARLWEREARLAAIAVLVDLEAIDDEPGQAQAVAVRRFVDRCDVTIILATRDPWRGIDRPGRVIDLLRPRSSEQEAAWRSLLPDEQHGLAGALSAQFNLGLADIGRIALEVGLPEVSGPDLPAILWTACRTAKRPQLERLAERIPNHATLEDLVLEPSARGLLDQLIAQVRLRSRVYDEWEVGARTTRGLGITAVFAGESGTGKTLAAEAIATELDLDLYRIDLSAVVDKYVGETEKQMRRTFEGGEDGGVILFFDEADALFGRRTEVKESHDRFANIEINYLLQRIETYRGLVILATNAKSAMDQAFLRRIRFIVNFPFPGPAERLEIWRRTIPVARQGADLDLARLARLSAAGGSIRNIGVNALFLAAADGVDTVSFAHARQAAADEFRKIGRPWNDELLGSATADGSEQAA
jgi:hypothetical protein